MKSVEISTLQLQIAKCIGSDFKKMTIDDNWDIIDLSDHCLITIQINIDKNNNKSTNKKTCIIFKKSINAIEKFIEYVFYIIGNSDQPINIEQFNNIIYEAEENRYTKSKTV